MYLRDSLAGSSDIVAIHGKGCLLGIEFADKCAPIHSKLLENRIITGTSSNANVLRLLPPLSVSFEEVDLLIDQLSDQAQHSARHV